MGGWRTNGWAVARSAAESARTVAWVVALASTGTAIVSSAVLLGRFSPEVGVESAATVANPVIRYGPEPWVSLHSASLSVAVTATLVWACLTAAVARYRTWRAAVLVTAAAVTAVGTIGVAALTWTLVRWDQLALWSVMTGEPSAFDGLWTPAVSDDVRFVLISGVEIRPELYRRWLAVHLLAPFAGAAALVAAQLVPRRGSTRTVRVPQLTGADGGPTRDFERLAPDR